jgi:EmrB/QacA subfamily drug resistance transporter
MAAIDFTIVAVALKAIQQELHTSILWAGWTVTAYTLGQLLVLPLAGAMSDEFGRKRVFLISVAIFTVSSLLCGLAPNIYVLIFFRLLQAIGGGAFLPSCTGIISDEFEDNRAQAIGLFTGVSPLGSIIGPNLGGILVDKLSWRFVFWVNVPIAIAVLLLTLFLYAQRRGEAKRQRPDYGGMALGGSAIIAGLFTITWIGDHPDAISSPVVWAAVVFAVVMIVLFWRRQKRIAHPIIEPLFIVHRPFLAANLYNLFYGAGAFGFSAFIPTYIQLRYGTDAAVAGALLTPRALTMVAIAMLASIFLLRLGYRLPMLAGLLLQALNLALLSRGYSNLHVLGFAVNDFAWLGFIMIISGLAFGVSQPASQNAVLDLLPARVGAVTGIRQMFRYIGGVFGTSLIVLVLTHYRSNAPLGYEHVFLALAVICLAIIPTVFVIPDTARERYRAAQQGMPQEHIVAEVEA